MFESLAEPKPSIAITSRSLIAGLAIPPAIIVLAVLIAAAANVQAGLATLIVGQLLFAAMGSITAVKAATAQSAVFLLAIPAVWVYAAFMGFYGYLAVLAVGPRFC